MQGELNEMKKKFVEFEEKYSQVEKESKEQIKAIEEAQLKATQLQETIERYIYQKEFFINMTISP